jgi:hypothetical protein
MPGRSREAVDRFDVTTAGSHTHKPVLWNAACTLCMTTDTMHLADMLSGAEQWAAHQQTMSTHGWGYLLLWIWLDYAWKGNEGSRVISPRLI